MRIPTSWIHHQERFSISASIAGFGILAACALVVVFLGAQVSLFVSQCCQTLSFDDEGAADGEKAALKDEVSQGTQVFRYHELRRATGNFDKKNLIGQGGFAKVYKAVLPDSTVVAVKRLAGKGHASDREFKAELETLGRVRHRNLVALIGFCRTREWNILVYEYFENGSLDRPIRGQAQNLDWPTRLRVMLGAARGLAYLHSCEPRIIHRDVKASNILLDAGLEAKVCDFGLARSMDASRTHLTTFLAGTRPYIAPEYQSSLKLTVKCDVYSFGVVLLELLTGKDPARGNLPDWVRALLQASGDLFDPRLRKSADRASLTDTLSVALQCTRADPHQRPTMATVVALLCHIYEAAAIRGYDEEAARTVSSFSGEAAVSAAIGDRGLEKGPHKTIAAA